MSNAFTEAKDDLVAVRNGYMGATQWIKTHGETINAALSPEGAGMEDSIPCVSCQKPADTSTPDDADMCWKCFGGFNAACFDELSGKYETLVLHIAPETDLQELRENDYPLPDLNPASQEDAAKAFERLIEDLPDYKNTDDLHGLRDIEIVRADLQKQTPNVDWEELERDLAFHCDQPDWDCSWVISLMKGHLASRATLKKTEASFQDRVAPWMQECFGPEISADTMERNHRFLEEALELVQACGCSKHDCLQLVDYVYSRPLGDQEQEVGGVRVTLAALCLAQGIDMHVAGETELTRISNPEMIKKIRNKQATKPAGSPLPQKGDEK